MTALAEFEKIEAVGIWRADAEAQRRDVIVTLGDASLTIFDTKDRVLAHWSIPAIARENPGQMPAIYHPDGDPDETLELGDESDVMVEAIEKLRKAVARRRPHPGRLRVTSAAVITAGIVALGVFWLPNAVRTQTLTALPDIKQRQIGAQIVQAAERFTSAACSAPSPELSLRKISRRVFPRSTPSVFVVPDGLTDVVALPGNTYLVGRALVEDFETPEVLAGFLLAASAASGGQDTLIKAVLKEAGLLENLKLLTTGDLPQAVADRFAESTLSATRTPVIDAALLRRFEAVEVSSRPYALAIDVTGEATLSLIEADPMAAQNPPAILTDGEWVALQGICES